MAASVLFSDTRRPGHGFRREFILLESGPLRLIGKSQSGFDYPKVRIRLGVVSQGPLSTGPVLLGEQTGGPGQGNHLFEQILNAEFSKIRNHHHQSMTAGNYFLFLKEILQDHLEV